MQKKLTYLHFLTSSKSTQSTRNRVEHTKMTEKRNDGPFESEQLAPPPSATTLMNVISCHRLVTRLTTPAQKGELHHKCSLLHWRGQVGHEPSAYPHLKRTSIALCIQMAKSRIESKSALELASLRDDANRDSPSPPRQRGWRW
jgi:hypothetical protein